MLHNLKKRNSQKGFTIIEVMIVLAIAGLIMLIVFLAVPALQRTSRNTQRKNDTSAIASGVANYIDNNGGTLPGKVAADSDGVSVDLCTGTNCTSGNKETAKLGYYDAAKIYLNSTSSISLTAVGSESSAKVSTESVIIDKGYTCDATDTGVGTANTRSAAILYATENGSGNGSLQCVEQ